MRKPVVASRLGSRGAVSSGWVTRVLFYALAAVFIFSFGVNVGRGDIEFTSGGGSVASRTLPDDLDYSSVEAVYDKIRTSYDGELSQQQLLDGLKAGLAQATGDPYTEYFTASEADLFNDQLEGTFSGIGAELGKDDNGNVIVISPLSGYPAEKAGLRAQDLIAEVDGDSLLGASVEEAVVKIRGEAGTDVALKVVRDNSQELDITITRQEIKIPSVEHEIKDGVGILTISRFGDDTAALTRRAADEFASQNVRGVVVDLRGNPGGLLDASVDVSGLWLDEGQVVVQEKQGGEVTQTFYGSADPVLKDKKTIVLINKGSASASEITAGALRDHGAATLLGETSFGKGSVQQLSEFGTGAMLKITVAHWFTPNGTGIDSEGIAPDQVVELSDDDIDNRRDPQLDAALDAVRQ